MPGPRPCGALQDDGCAGGSCSEPCSGVACTSRTNGQCVDAKGGLSQVCCSDDTQRACFPTASGGAILRRGSATAPAPSFGDPTYPKVGGVTLVGAFCAAGSGSTLVDGLAGLARARRSGAAGGDGVDAVTPTSRAGRRAPSDTLRAGRSAGSRPGGTGTRSRCFLVSRSITFMEFSNSSMGRVSSEPRRDHVVEELLAALRAQDGDRPVHARDPAAGDVGQLGGEVAAVVALRPRVLLRLVEPHLHHLAVLLVDQHLALDVELLHVGERESPSRPGSSPPSGPRR